MKLKKSQFIHSQDIINKKKSTKKDKITNLRTKK